MKKNNNKGFTLAELLIVVAIIAVLVAVAIPVFNAQLEKSRDAVTVSNLRSAYAMAQTAYLTGQDDSANGVTITKDANNVITAIEVAGVVSKGVKAGFSDAETELPFTPPAAMGGTADTYDVTFNYNANAEITSVTA